MFECIKYIKEVLFCCLISLPFYLLYRIYPNYIIAHMGGVITLGVSLVVSNLKGVKNER